MKITSSAQTSRQGYRRPPPPALTRSTKYANWVTTAAKESARREHEKFDNYCAYMPTTHEEYLSTSHICIPGHFCPPKHQCPVGFELYNYQKYFCFDIQPMDHIRRHIMLVEKHYGDETALGYNSRLLQPLA